ncbi:helix-turn-helix domain-containing protein [Helcobacillus massiliensis]|uniref:helix-turn-helix domain-containing protein n=1 Tax=Helcobacillus massiliensis TaxID=521392 RepID=UPI0021A7B486|nr:helix-turn-helix domain-containing protein [Helcobacillus massiliensis]MCT1557376.1 helix-turn-helix domain-containing protein [Helcobacillus massiliensis]MCT2036901.1 helix-turn-helix domain-containing protein [Helcobacillus massiliensis]MCT2331661.1 helix-turn-helix domain-containing protein [Helcobacillus massiliensis]
MSQVMDNLFVNALSTAPDLLTTEEVAQLFRVTPSTVLRWVALEDLKCLQVGPKLHRFPKWCIEEYVSTAAENSAEQ